MGMRPVGIGVGFAVGLALLTGGCSGPVEQERTWDRYMQVLNPRAGLTVAEMTALTVEQNRVREQYVVGCMKAAGFDYTPDTGQDAELFSGADLDPDIVPGSREYAQTYGYGRTPLPGTRVPPGTVAGGSTDPNLTMIGAMSQAERNQYYRALFGSSDDAVSPDSCYGRAENLPEVREARTDPVWLALYREYLAAERLGVLTERVGRAAVDWHHCMAENGYDIADPDRVPEYLTTTIADSWFDAAETEVAQDHATEISLATADWDCQEATGYRRALVEATADFDRQFVQSHRAELDALVERYATEGEPER